MVRACEVQPGMVVRDAVYRATPQRQWRHVWLVRQPIYNNRVGIQIEGNLWLLLSPDRQVEIRCEEGD